jgi:hypothetical protein
VCIHIAGTLHNILMVGVEFNCTITYCCPWVAGE